MNKVKHYVLALFMVLGVSLFTACNEEEVKEKLIPTILSGSSEEVSVLSIGETKSFVVTPQDGKVDPKLVWTSSDEKVATVENGVVTGVSVGYSTITVTLSDEQTVSYTVLVYAANSVVFNYGEEIMPIEKCTEKWSYDYEAYNYEGVKDIFDEILVFYPSCYEMDVEGGINSDKPGIVFEIKLGSRYIPQTSQAYVITPIPEGWKSVNWSNYKRLNCEEKPTLDGEWTSVYLEDKMIYIKKDGDVYEIVATGNDSNSNSVILHYKGKIEVSEYQAY